MNYFCSGSVNTHWGSGLVNTNREPGPGAKQRAEDQEIQLSDGKLKIS